MGELARRGCNLKEYNDLLRRPELSRTECLDHLSRLAKIVGASSSMEDFVRSGLIKTLVQRYLTRDQHLSRVATVALQAAASRSNDVCRVMWDSDICGVTAPLFRRGTAQTCLDLFWLMYPLASIDSYRVPLMNFEEYWECMKTTLFARSSMLESGSVVLWTLDAISRGRYLPDNAIGEILDIAGKVLRRSMPCNVAELLLTGAATEACLQYNKSDWFADYCKDWENISVYERRYSHSTINDLVGMVDEINADYPHMVLDRKLHRELAFFAKFYEGHDRGRALVALLDTAEHEECKQRLAKDHVTLIALAELMGDAYSAYTVERRGAALVLYHITKCMTSIDEFVRRHVCVREGDHLVSRSVLEIAMMVLLSAKEADVSLQKICAHLAFEILAHTENDIVCQMLDGPQLQHLGPRLVMIAEDLDAVPLQHIRFELGGASEYDSRPASAPPLLKPRVLELFQALIDGQMITNPDLTLSLKNIVQAHVMFSLVN